MSPERWILIPGFMKAGSTSVFSWLEAALPAPVARPKEPRFFLQDWENAADLDRYWRESSGGSGTAIDGSVAYLDPAVSPSVAARISSASVGGPSPRFIVMVRDPVARAISHIRHDIRRGRLDRVDDAGAAALIRPGLPYFERSRLATSMRPFVETFPTEHILILGSDVEDAGQLSAISAFLGLPGPRTDVRIGRKNETSSGTVVHACASLDRRSRPRIESRAARPAAYAPVRCKSIAQTTPSKPSMSEL